MISLMYCILLLLLLQTSCKATNKVDNDQYRSIAGNINITVDPCEDYYQYACGNWQNVHNNKNYHETIGLVDHKANMEFVRILNSEKNKKRKEQPLFVSMLLKYQRSCTAIIDYNPLEYLEYLENNENIIWPPIVSGRKQNKIKYDWLEMLGILRKYGFNSIFIESIVIQNRDDGQLWHIDIDKPVLKGPLQVLDFDNFGIVLQSFNLTSEDQITKSMYEEFNLFETKVKSLEDISDEVGYESVTLAELAMPWLEKYLRVFSNVTYLPQSLNISIQNRPYLQALDELLQKYDDEYLSHYLMLRFLWYINIEGPESFKKTDCVAHIRRMFPLAMNWLYEQHNPQLQAAAEDVISMFNIIQNQFQQQIETNINHFNANTKKFLIAKIQSMKIKIGNLPRGKSTDLKLVEIYRPYAENISPNAFYVNHMHALRMFNFDQLTLTTFRRLPQVDEEYFFFYEDADTASNSSPYYLIRYNVVIVPLTMLQPPIYHKDMHRIFKYSLLGFLLAHEITHGFDDSGLEFDKMGNMKGPSDIIKENELFDENIECVRSINPQTVDEKIADVSGLRWAFESYFNTSIVEEMPKMPRSLNMTTLTPKELFFLNFAVFFCGDKNLDNENSSREHGSDYQRVLDTLGNFAEFARVYDCPVGSTMHPEKKCQLWR